jgi:hypothetical protein
MLNAFALVIGSFYQAEKADKNIPTTTGNTTHLYAQFLFFYS